MRIRSQRLLLALLVLSLGALASGPATGQTDLNDARRQRDEIRANAESLATDIDVVQGEASAIEAALAAVEENARIAGVDLGNAEAALAQHEGEAQLLNDQIIELEAQRAALLDTLRSGAIDEFITGDSDSAAGALTSNDPNEWARRSSLFSIASGELSSDVDAVRDIEADLDVARRQAEQEVLLAEQDKARIEGLLVEAQAAADLQQRLLDEVSARLEARLSEAAAIEELDAQLSAEIQAEEARLAAEAAKARSRSGSSSGNGSSGNSSGGSRPLPVAPADIVTVWGIQVHKSIAGDLEALLQAADADGVSLGGAGYRSSDRQIELRRQHCGSSDYDIWDAPAGSCSPPTARPGLSNHEKGLAIDFTNSGRSILTRSDPAFEWLKANAGRFGFVNLPSEPWHWSQDGN